MTMHENIKKIDVYQEKIKVIVVDDVQQVIEGIVLYLSLHNMFEVIGTYNTGNEIVKSKLLEKADVVLMDIEMPGMNGLEAAKRVSHSHPSVKMIAITMYQHNLYLQDTVKSGFHGYVEKGRITDDLLNVMDTVIEEKVANPNIR